MRWASLIFFSALLYLVHVSSEEVTADSAAYSGKQNQDWERIQAQLSEKKAQLDTQENLIKTLLAEKSVLRGAALSEKVTQIKTEHQRFERLSNEYNKLNEEYHTKFPERGLKEKRVYTRPPVKSLRAIEEDLSVQGRVKKVHKKVLSQYAKGQEKRKKTPQTSELVSSDETNIKSVTDPIQYKK